MGAGLEELREYERFVARRAPVAYARLYVATGDFAESQARLERAFLDGFPEWRRARDERSLDPLIEREAAAPAPPSDAHTAFSGTRRVRETEAAVALLRSLPAERQVELFLECVENVPSAAPAAEKEQLAALAQFRLSPSFAGRVVGMIRSRAPGRGRAAVIVESIVRGALCAGLVWALFGAALSWLDPGRLASPPEPFNGWLDRWPNAQVLFEVFVLALLAIDLIVLLTSWVVRRCLDAGRPLMRVLDYAGLALTVTTFLALVGWMWAKVPAFGVLLALGHLLWWPAALACIVGALKHRGAVEA